MEMSKADLSAPEYHMEAFMLYAMISNKGVINTPHKIPHKILHKTPHKIAKML